MNTIALIGFGIVIFGFGVAIGALAVYKWEERAVKELMRLCDDTKKELERVYEEAYSTDTKELEKDVKLWSYSRDNSGWEDGDEDLDAMYV